MGEKPIVKFRAPKTWIGDVDDTAARQGVNRSEYIREAVRRQMQRDLIERKS